MTAPDDTLAIAAPMSDRGLHCCAGAGQIGPIPKGGPMTTSPLSDMTLALIAVRDHRDREAFGQLFDYFGPRLKAMLIRSGQRDGAAEDIVQDVMLVVWRKASQFDPHRAGASAWIYRIARNRHIDLARRRAVPQPDILEDRPDMDPDPAQILALAEETRHLRDALSRLSADQRRALEHSYFEDLPHSQISQLTGLPIGTIKSRIRLGLERLRHELRDLQS